MTHYDLTKDGKVDSRELRTIAYMDHKLPPAISDDIFRKADRNGDKFIDRIEIITAARLIQRHVERATLRWLEDHDTDSDGLLNEAELFESIYMELGLSTRYVSGCFRESDVNKDGYLTSSELVETLHCSRLLALKEAKELLKIYDTDGDHRLNIQEAQMLAGLRYDIEPNYAAIVFEDVSHRADHKINELELIDFLTKLREEAAIAALSKLSSLDQNGDEAVSFGELLYGYDKQLKKSVLKKIFSKVDVNKNAHIDPIESVSLQNLIADEIRLQTIQNDFEKQYSTTKNAATFAPPTLIIFNPSKKPRNQQKSRRHRKRRSDPNADTKLMINDESRPGIRELTATNTSGVNFSSFVTAVPKFITPSDEYQRFLSNGADLISEMFASTKKSKGHRDVAEINDVEKIRENSISDDSLLTLPMMQRDRKLTSDENEGKLESRSRSNENVNVQNQNGALSNSPQAAYIKKFEKFFDFLQKTIKKISKAVNENNEKPEESLKSPLRSINIIKHSTPIANNDTSNSTADDIQEATSVSENPISISTTTEKSKIYKNLNNKIYNEQNLIAHTPIDESEFKTVIAKKFSGNFDTPFLQADEKDIETNVKVIHLQRDKRKQSLDERKHSLDGREHLLQEREHSFKERNFQDAIESDENNSEDIVEDDCILEGQTDSIDSDEQSARSVKLYKCNTKTRISNPISTGSLEKIPKKLKKVKLPSESNDKSKMQDKSLNKMASLEYERTSSLSHDESSSFGHQAHSEHDSDEIVEMISDTEGDGDSDESSNEITSATKETIANELSKHESINKHNEFTQVDEHDKSIHNTARKLLSPKAVILNREKSLSEFGLPLVVDKESNGYKIPQSNSITEENVTKKNVSPQLQTTDSQLSQSQSSSLEQVELQVTTAKSQEIPNNNDGNEFFNEILNDMLNATFSEINQTSK
uniref:Calmodulin n=1 Tax=Elaeophora elaphi TaxID=1147741 RepID=A0A0R3RKE7_9BILA